MLALDAFHGQSTLAADDAPVEEWVDRISSRRASVSIPGPAAIRLSGMRLADLVSPPTFLKKSKIKRDPIFELKDDILRRRDTRR